MSQYCRVATVAADTVLVADAPQSPFYHSPTNFYGPTGFDAARFPGKMHDRRRRRNSTTNNV